MAERKNIVVLTGAGISAESGISTFRDQGGLWEGYDIEDVATPQAFERQPETVLEFYNERRRKVKDAEPNEGHKALAKLEEQHDVTVITQNIDDLHERAGSTNVVHLHGQIKQAKSSGDPSLIYDISTEDIKMGDKCKKGYQLRPHVVWFGEPVPMMEKAMRISSEAEVFMVVGTSLAVYPAASLIDFVPLEAVKYIIDKQIPAVGNVKNLKTYELPATEGVPKVLEELMEGEKSD